MTTGGGGDAPVSGRAVAHRRRVRLAAGWIAVSVAAGVIALVTGGSLVLMVVEFVVAACGVIVLVEEIRRFRSSWSGGVGVADPVQVRSGRVRAGEGSTVVQRQRRGVRGSDVLVVVLVVVVGAVLEVLSHEDVMRRSTSGPIFTAVVLVGYLAYVWRRPR